MSAYGTGYLEHTWQTGRLEFTPGVRLSHFGSGSYTGLSPRVSGHFFVNDRLRLKAGWGIYHQYINLISVEGFSFTTDIVASRGTKPWIPAGRFITHSGLSSQPKIGRSIRRSITRIWRTWSNSSHRSAWTKARPSLTSSFRAREGLTAGELLIRKTSGSTKGWIRLYPGLDTPDISRPQRRKIVSAQGRPAARHLVRRESPVTWKLERECQLGLRHGTGYTIPESRYEVVQPRRPVDLFDVHVSEKNAYRLPAYHRMDLGITKDFRFGGVESQFVISVFNLYNRRNIWYRTYDVSEEEVVFQDVLLQRFCPALDSN